MTGPHEVKTCYCSVSVSKTATLLPNAAKSLLKDHFFGDMLRHLPDKLMGKIYKLC